MSPLRLMMVGCILLILPGCDFIEEKWMKIRFENTVTIIAWCAEKNRSRLEAIGVNARSFCALRHSKTEINPSQQGGGRFNCLTDWAPSAPTNSFTYTFTNGLEHVVTFIEISILLKANNQIVRSSRENVWVLPGETARVVLSFSRTFPCPDFVSEGRASLWEWTQLIVGSVRSDI